jgi:hypothetical protein
MLTGSCVNRVGTFMTGNYRGHSETSCAIASGEGVNVPLRTGKMIVARCWPRCFATECAAGGDFSNAGS